MVQKKTLRINGSIYALLAISVFGQTNNIDNPDVVIHRLEDLYIQNISTNEKPIINLSGQIQFEKDQFGLTKRVISYPALKILF
jgi:hypothetical protein